MGATDGQRNWPEMLKTLGKPGFLAERTGTELLSVFAVFFDSSKGATFVG
jgi:hypothetical protein